MKEKTKLEKEAIAAFKTRYNELPADAGWPVVNEWKGQVYFARSIADWNKYKRIMRFYSFSFLTAGLSAFAAVVALVFGLYWVSLAMLVAYFILLIAAVVFQKPLKKSTGEVLNYQHYDKRIIRIAI